MMSEQVSVTPEQARKLISAKSGQPAPSVAPTILELHTRSEEIREGGTLGVATIILSGTADPNELVHIYDTGGAIAQGTVSDPSGKWSAMVPSLVRGEHVFTARTYQPTMDSEPWRLFVAVGERIEFGGIESPYTGSVVPCGIVCATASTDPVEVIRLQVRGEIGTTFQIANTGESPEPPPPGSLLWGPVETITRHRALYNLTRLGTPPVLNWYHIRTLDSEAAVISKCLGNFVLVT